MCIRDRVFSHLDRLAAKAHLSEGDRIAYDKAVYRYNVSRIVENDIREQAVAEGLSLIHISGTSTNFLQRSLSHQLIHSYLLSFRL